MRPNNPLASFIRWYGSIDPSLHSYQPRSERNSKVALPEMDKPPSTPIYDQFKAKSTTTLDTHQTVWPSYDNALGSSMNQKAMQRASTSQEEQATSRSLRSRPRRSFSQVESLAHTRFINKHEESKYPEKEYDSFDFQVQPLAVSKKAKDVLSAPNFEPRSKHKHTLSPILQSPMPLTQEFLREHTEREVLNAFLDGRHEPEHLKVRSPLSPVQHPYSPELYNYNPHATPPSQFDQRSLFPPLQPHPRQQDFQAYRYFTHSEVDRNHWHDQLRQSTEQTRTPSLVRSSVPTVTGELHKSSTLQSLAKHEEKTQDEDDTSSHEVVYANRLTRGMVKIGRKAKQIYRKLQVAHEEEKRMAWIAWQQYVAEHGEELGIRLEL